MTSAIVVINITTFMLLCTSGHQPKMALVPARLMCRTTIARCKLTVAGCATSAVVTTSGRQVPSPRRLAQGKGAGEIRLYGCSEPRPFTMRGMAWRYGITSHHVHLRIITLHGFQRLGRPSRHLIQSQAPPQSLGRAAPSAASLSFARCTKPDMAWFEICYDLKSPLI